MCVGGDRWRGCWCSVVIAWQKAALHWSLQRLPDWQEFKCRVCCAKGRDSESIDPQICSILWKAKARTRYEGSEELGLSKTNQQRTKVNKGNIEKDWEEKVIERVWGWSIRRETRPRNIEKQKLTHGGLKSPPYQRERKNKETSFTDAESSSKTSSKLWNWSLIVFHLIPSDKFTI